MNGTGDPLAWTSVCVFSTWLDVKNVEVRYGSTLLLTSVELMDICVPDLFADQHGM